eukprot:NODE_123_length_2434_cov_113.373585_g89_i0.p1 GENE.NODE_123_length_2434_cov_113.373585_g89_i0~~NODE_123_length_2434_cov_113.373585_g89_i0.p1  ORF type:complete len:737 (+),score=148.81 NODE_123_length_2434_cov_113.373585_g89_i0:76-2286(+)
MLNLVEVIQQNCLIFVKIEKSRGLSAIGLPLIPFILEVASSPMLRCPQRRVCPARGGALRGTNLSRKSTKAYVKGVAKLASKGFDPKSMAFNAAGVLLDSILPPEVKEGPVGVVLGILGFDLGPSDMDKVSGKLDKLSEQMKDLGTKIDALGTKLDALTENLNYRLTKMENDIQTLLAILSRQVLQDWWRGMMGSGSNGDKLQDACIWIERNLKHPAEVRTHGRTRLLALRNAMINLMDDMRSDGKRFMEAAETVQRGTKEEAEIIQMAILKKRKLDGWLLKGLILFLLLQQALVHECTTGKIPQDTYTLSASTAFATSQGGTTDLAKLKVVSFAVICHPTISSYSHIRLKTPMGNVQVFPMYGLQEETYALRIASDGLLVSTVGRANSPHSSNSKQPTLPHPYIGCYHDQPSRVLGAQQPNSSSMTVSQCRTSCGAQGYSYAGLQYARECFCSNQYKNATLEGSKSAGAICNMPCAGNSKEMCGGVWANSVYATGATPYVVNPPALHPKQSWAECKKTCKQTQKMLAGVNSLNCVCGAYNNSNIGQSYQGYKVAAQLADESAAPWFTEGLGDLDLEKAITGQYTLHSTGNMFPEIVFTSFPWEIRFTAVHEQHVQAETDIMNLYWPEKMLADFWTAKDAMDKDWALQIARKSCGPPPAWPLGPKVGVLTPQNLNVCGNAVRSSGEICKSECWCKNLQANTPREDVQKGVKEDICSDGRWWNVKTTGGLNGKCVCD